VSEAVARLDEASDVHGASLALADDLMSVAEAMDGQYLLRRTLTEPHATPDELARLVNDLLGKSVSASAIAIMRVAVAQTWASADELVGAVRDTAIRVGWRAAIDNRTVEMARDQVLGLLMTTLGDAEFATAVGDVSRDAADRRALVRTVLTQAHHVAVLCANCAIGDQRGNFVQNLDRCLDVLAALRDHVRARVTTAVAMTEQQTAAMNVQLSRIYSHPIDLETVVDSRVVGGVLVNVGGDVIDGSIRARLDTARQALTNVPVVDEKDE